MGRDVGGGCTSSKIDFRGPGANAIWKFSRGRGQSARWTTIIVDSGYKTISTVRSSRDEISQLLRTVDALHTVLSRLQVLALSDSSAGDSLQDSAFSLLTQHEILPQCETTLSEVERLLHNLEQGSKHRLGNVSKAFQ